MRIHQAPCKGIPMKSLGPKWLKNSRWNTEGSKNLMDSRVGWKRLALRLTSTPIKIAPNIHFCPVFSFHSASHDVATARRSAPLPPYIKPERAAAQSHAVAPGAESRNRSLIPFQAIER